MFDEVESAFLTPLPDAPFEVCDWVYGRAVNLDFHVVFDKNRYSVPYQHVGAKADLRVTANAVDVYVGGAVASPATRACRHSFSIATRPTPPTCRPSS